jgi:hypothetical protein
MPTALLLAHIEMWVAELEREVLAFEAAVEEVEEAMEKAEENGTRGVPGEDDQRQEHGERPIPPRLAAALAKAAHVAELVNAAQATLDEAICAAQQVMANEVYQEQPVASPEAMQVREPRLIRASLVSPRAGTEQELEREAGFEPLSHGAAILAGRYRIVELLHARPRVNLYLAYRLASASEQAQGAPSSSLVAIREIVMTGLPPDMQERIERAAFEEFVAPGLLGSPRLPGVGDRISVEHERHYLVMQLRPAREERIARQAKPGSRENAAIAVPLAELLLKHQQWPQWLDMETALEWGVQLCRIVARLHRMGTMLGDLDPATVLVNSRASAGPSSWAPVLLVSWPPALQFWAGSISSEQYAQLFPIAENLSENAFAAPETLVGRASECSDVYSLGAILYLLFTRYAPAAAALREPVEQTALQHGGNRFWQSDSANPFGVGSGMALVPPHLFNNLISPRLERLLLRALALSPEERFSSVFELVEALEAIDPAAEFVDHYEGANGKRRDSKIMKALGRVRGGDHTGCKDES